MKKRKICILIVSIVVLIGCGIIITNLKYSKNMKALQLSSDEWFVGAGYAVRLNRHEVLDMEKLREYVIDTDQLDMYQKAFQMDGKVVLVYLTLRVTDRNLMNKEWWTDFILNSDNGWRNPTEPYLSALIKDSNPAKGNYEDGGEYDLIFPFAIAKVQVPEYEYDNADNWKYSIIWSQNPIVYSQIN